MNGPMQEITLSGGAKVMIPVHAAFSKCKGCHADDIIWGKTKNGKNIPIHWVEDEGWVCHFSDCPNAKKFRKSKNKND